MRLEEKLEALAQDYEHKAAAIRTTALALSSTLRKKAEADFPTKLRKAVATQSNGHKANGNGHRQLHWTKRPENAAKLAKMQRKGARTRWVQQHPEVNRPPAAEPADNKRRSKLLAQRQRRLIPARRDWLRPSRWRLDSL